MKKRMLIAALLVLSLVFSVSCQAEERHKVSEKSGIEKYEAPNFTVYDENGRAFMLSDFAGKPVVLNFWASWCGPCRSEMPEDVLAYLEEGQEKQRVNFESDICFSNELADEIMQDVLNNRASCGEDN